MFLHTFPNGLRLLLEEVHTAPVLSFNALFLVGSADEVDEEAGISHVIEHMLFKGTPTQPVGTIARDVEAAGGDINAYTSFDQTVYYINMARAFGDKGLSILADAVQHPLFDAAELEREKEVIVEEIRRERDNPGRYIQEILFQESFQKHPYGRPIIGFEKTVRSFTREKLLEYYRRWYTPDNTVLIVVGDFDSETMIQKVERGFSSFKGVKGPSALTRQCDIPLQQTRIRVQPDNIQTTYLAWGWPVPNITHEDIPALDVLAHILAGTDSSRLEQEIKEKRRLVQSIYAYAYTPRDPGLFLLGAQVSQKKMAKALPAILGEIKKIQTDGVRPHELQHARLNIRASQIFERETVGGLAGKYAYFLATAGRADFDKDYFHKLEEVRAEDVRRVAQKYLDPARLAATFMVPKETKETLSEKKVSQWLRTPPSRPKSPTRPKSDSREWTLENGLRLILREEHKLPLVSVTTAGLGGLFLESLTNNGISNLIFRTLTKGTRDKTALQIAKTLEGMAGTIDGFSGRNASGLKGEFLSDSFEMGMHLFGEILLEPAFTAEEVDKEKSFTLEAIRNQEDNLSSLAYTHFQKLLYPRHPFGMRGLGEPETLKRLNPARLKKYYRQWLTGKNLVVSIVGDIDSEEVRDKMAALLGKLPKREVGLARPKPDPKPKQIRTTTIKKEKMQAHLVLGFQGTTFGSPDYYPLLVLSTILSGQGGRLFIELRDRLSLAYSIHCSMQSGVDPGFLSVYIGTEPSKVPVALEGIKKELEKITKKPVTPEELERTRQYLAGSYQLDLQKNSQLASSYTLNTLYGLGIEEVENYPKKILKVTREEVLRVAQKYIDLTAYTAAIIAP